MENKRKGQVFIFTDASHCAYKKYASVGYVMKNHSRIIKQFSEIHQNISNINFAEILAVKTAIVEAIYSTKYRVFIICTDSLNLYQQYLRWVNDSSYNKLEPILIDSMYFANMEGAEVRIHYVKGHSKSKLNNKVHNLVKNTLVGKRKSPYVET